MFKKVALVMKGQVSTWKSCQQITGNLQRAYTGIPFLELKEFFLPAPFNAYRAIKAAEEIHAYSPELIIYIDHHPCPADFIEGLEVLYQSVSFDHRPKLLLHLFGDFVLDCQKWKRVEPLLAKWPLHFKVASLKQKNLIASFFKASRDIISVTPFPVNTELFNLQGLEDSRAEFRKKLEIQKDDIVLVYSGRISFQKNVEQLIKVFKSIEIFFDQKLKLLIAGPWDDILLPYFGKHGAPGSYYDHFKTTLPNDPGENIFFLGDLSFSSLREALLASDLFVSFSTYNDEDYGMAVAEALCLGLPCLLSDWAGYSSFKNYGQDVALIPVAFHHERPMVDLSLSRKMLLKLASSPFDLSKRVERAIAAEKHLSISSIKEKLIYDLDALSFNSPGECSPLFNKLCSSFKNNPRSPFTEELYKEVYGSYGI